MVCWIDQPGQLHQRYHQRAPDLQQIGLDTEFIHESTYWPQLALVQMAVGDEIWLVDPLVPGMDQALSLWLNDTDIVKIIHSASQDLGVFKYACNILPRPLFDTQIGATFAGIGSGSYQKLVNELAGVALAKSQTRSHWLCRPLTKAQCDYAADDVRYLFVLAKEISARLQALGRRAWFEEDMQRLLATSDDHHNERWPHLHSHAAQMMDAAAQIRLLRLLRWREQHAQNRNIPRGWILDNELVATLARHPPTHFAALKRVLSTYPKAPRKLAEPLWQALVTPLADEIQMPYLSSTTGELDRPTLKRMQEVVAQRSAELGLPEGLLASRKALTQLLQSGQWPLALMGWRKTQLEPLLRPFLP